MDEIIPGKLYLGDLMDGLSADLSTNIDRAIAVCSEYECVHKCSDSWCVGFVDGASVHQALIHKAVKLIHQGILQGKRVLVHCVAGISRSPMIVACYLVKSGQFYDFDKALEFVHQCRSGREYCRSSELTLPNQIEPTIVMPY